MCNQCIQSKLIFHKHLFNFWINSSDFVSRPDYISPLDDLAFDMYQDPEIAQIIRRLEKKKQEAVLRK